MHQYLDMCRKRKRQFYARHSIHYLHLQEGYKITRYFWLQESYRITRYFWVKCYRGYLGFSGGILSRNRTREPERARESQRDRQPGRERKEKERKREKAVTFFVRGFFIALGTIAARRSSCVDPFVDSLESSDLPPFWSVCVFEGCLWARRACPTAAVCFSISPYIPCW